jgi:hypothetical protein
MQALIRAHEKAADSDVSGFFTVLRRANGLRLTLKAAKPFALIAMQQSGLELLDEQRGFEPAAQRRGFRFKAFDAVTKAAEAQRAFGGPC